MDTNVWFYLGTVGLITLLGIMLGMALDRLRCVERKLDVLLKQTGVDLAGLADREAGALLEANRNVEAIRAYRAFTGAGIAEAREHIESLRGGLRTEKSVASDS